jgi:glycosyltransferase involved in cell wall biosynthesis
VTDGENVLLADSPEQLVEAISRVVRDADLRSKLVDGAYSLVRSRYEWSTLGAKLHEHFGSLLSNAVNQI